ncbi:carboxypeptidase regulatory-like domain-containing protein, partial [bacterium]
MVSIYGAPVPNYALSGVITIGTGKLSGVLVKLNNGQSAKTNTSGVFTFPTLPAGSYTLTPVKTGNSFSPSSLAIKLLGNVTTANFAATATTTVPVVTPVAPPVIISIPSVAMVENNAGSPYMTFNVSLSEPSQQT